MEPTAVARVVVVGRGGSGKTTLLRVVEELARKSNINCRISLEEGQDFQTVPEVPVRYEFRCAYEATSCHADEIVVVCANNPAHATAYADAFNHVAHLQYEEWIWSKDTGSAAERAAECEARAQALLVLLSELH